MAKKNRRGCCGCFPLFGLLVLGVFGFIGYKAYQFVFNSNTINDENVELLIPTGATFDQVLDSINADNLLKSEVSFIQTSRAKKYDKNVKSGRYIIPPHQSNNDLVNRLRSGNQTAVKFVINNVRTPEDFAGKVGKQLEIDSMQMLLTVKNPEVAEKYGFNLQTFPAMFLANTYEIYWDTTMDLFLNRMQSEYNKFWTPERLEQAQQIGLSPVEVITLASIVEEETKQSSELPIVAGLYLNRLKQGMPLQADPTVKFAVGDFTLRRILNKHLEVDSPYNTYKYSGLPPGPIRIPELSAVKAVLQPAEHDYLYMAAKEDFSGYHNFAKTLPEHNQNADRYRRALNERGIMK